MSVIPLDNGDIVLYRNPVDGKMQVNLSRGGVRDVAYLSEVEFLAPSALELQGFGYQDTNALIRFSGKRTSLTFKDVKGLRAFKSEVDSARRAMGFHKPEVLRTQPTQPPSVSLNLTGGVPVGAPPGAAPGRSPLAANGVGVGGLGGAFSTHTQPPPATRPKAYVGDGAFQAGRPRASPAPVQYGGPSSSSSSSSSAPVPSAGLGGYAQPAQHNPALAPAPVAVPPPRRESAHGHRMPDSQAAEDEMIQRALALSAQEPQPAGPSEHSLQRQRMQQHTATDFPSEQELSGYVTLGEIGAGGQGSLFQGTTRDGRKKFVIKKIKCSTPDEKEKIYMWALQFQTSVTHPNIIPYLKVDGSHRTEVVILMPMYTEGDMEKYISNAKKAIPEHTIVNFMVQIADALKYLHTFRLYDGKPRPMLHRDLKPANILLAEGHSKCILIDFDSWGRTGVADREGTMEYQAPEALPGITSGASLDCSSDIFSFGVILFILMALPSYPMLELNGESLLLSASEWASQPDKLREAVYKSVQRHGRYSPQLIDLCLDMLSHDHRRRPDAASIIRRLDSLR